MATQLKHLGRGVREAALDIRSELLACRESLPKAGNHWSPAPSDPYARYLLAEVQNDRLMAITHLLFMTKVNLEDDMPYADATRWLRRFERYVEGYALAGQSRGILSFRPIDVPVRRETKAEGAFNMAEIPLVQNDRDPAILRAAIQAARLQEEATADVRLECERRLVSLVGSAS